MHGGQHIFRDGQGDFAKVLQGTCVELGVVIQLVDLFDLADLGIEKDA